jgi:hypothetical protein
MYSLVSLCAADAFRARRQNVVQCTNAKLATGAAQLDGNKWGTGKTTETDSKICLYRPRFKKTERWGITPAHRSFTLVLSPAQVSDGHVLYAASPTPNAFWGHIVELVAVRLEALDIEDFAYGVVDDGGSVLRHTAFTAIDHTMFYFVQLRVPSS